MRLIARWDRHKQWIVYIEGFEEKAWMTKICGYCTKKVKDCQVIHSRMFFDDNVLFSFRPSNNILESFSKISFPLRVHEEAVIIDRHHIDLPDVHRKKLQRSLEIAISRIIKLLEKDFEHAIITFQSGYLTQGTLSHPHFRIFALNLNMTKDKKDRVTSAGLKVLEKDSVSLLLPFVRKFAIEFSAEINIPRKGTSPLSNILIESFDILHNIPFQGVISVHRGLHSHIRIVHDKYLPKWPLSAFILSGLEITFDDLDERDVYVDYLISGERYEP